MNWKQRYDRVEPLLRSRGLTTGKVLEAESYLIETPIMWEAALSVSKKDPLFFVERVADP